MIGSVSNNDGDVNENGKKAKGLLYKSWPLEGDVLCLIKAVISFRHTAINLAHAIYKTHVQGCGKQRMLLCLNVFSFNVHLCKKLNVKTTIP